MSDKGFYKTLGIQKDATADEVKKAYRKLVLIHHPDRAGSTEESEERFREIQEAYEVLSDEVKRKAYDRGNIYDISSLLKKKPDYPTQKELYRIRMRVRPRMTRVGDEVEVVIDIHQIISSEIELLNLKHFKVVRGPEMADLKYKNNKRIFRRVRYTLVPVSTGYIPVGPVTVIHRGVRYISSEVLINVGEAGKKIYQPKRGISTAHAFFMATIAIGFFLMIGYNLYRYGTKPRKWTYEMEAYQPPVNKEDVQLKTGATPYEQYWGRGKEDKLVFNKILFRNGDLYDVVVVLLQKKTNEVIRHNYIRANQLFIMEHIPNGEYYLKAQFGRDWDADKVNDSTILFGGFNRFQKYELLKEEERPLIMDQFLDGDTLDHSIYQITLFPLSEGNTRGEDISSVEFFE